MPRVFAPSPLAGEGQDGGRSGSPLRINDNGDLILHAESGEIRLHKPRIYQEINGVKQPIPGGYVLFELETRDSQLETHQVGFQVAAYDTGKPLIIDPVLSYSTYLGGSSDDAGLGIAVDTSGNAYVTGGTASPNFPTANPLQAAFGGYYDAFVAKVNSTGSALVYSTYLGGGSYDFGVGIAVDASGSAYVTGFTISPNFPTANPLQPAFGGGSFPGDAFVAKVELAVSTPVTIDIKPGSYPNSINLGSGGTVPVAIFSTATFNALTVDPATVTLASAPVKLKGQGTPMASFADVDGNGVLDLVVHVTTEALQLSETDTEATLEGETFDGTLIRGVDTVRVVP